MLAVIGRHESGVQATRLTFDSRCQISLHVQADLQQHYSLHPPQFGYEMLPIIHHSLDVPTASIYALTASTDIPILKHITCHRSINPAGDNLTLRRNSIKR